MSTLAWLVGFGCFGGVATDSAEAEDSADAPPPWDAGPFATAGGVYSITLEPDPYPPVAGPTTLHLTVAAAGAPVLGAVVTVVPFMPSMGHGISGEATITELGEGGYDAAWSYPMDGAWELTTTIESPAATDTYVAEIEVG